MQQVRADGSMWLRESVLRPGRRRVQGMHRLPILASLPSLATHASFMACEAHKLQLGDRVCATHPAQKQRNHVVPLPDSLNL